MAGVGVTEARAHLFALLERVSGGDRITVTKRGRPVAQIVPVELAPPVRTDLVEELKRRRGATLRLHGPRRARCGTRDGPETPLLARGRDRGGRQQAQADAMYSVMYR
jgi:prevent-host-death family protein